MCIRDRLGKLAQVTVTGGAQHLETLTFDRLGQGPDTQARGVLGPEVFIDDDDGKAEFHADLRAGNAGLAKTNRREV